MRKIIYLILTVSFMLSLNNSVYATQITETKYFSDVYLAEGPILQYLDVYTYNTYSYTHDTPDSFTVPYDTVNEANITISGYWIDGEDDVVSIEAVASGSLVTDSLNEGGEHYSYWVFSNWSWSKVSVDNPSITTIDIASIFTTSWSVTDYLSITITPDGGLLDGIIELTSSTFYLDYEDGTAPENTPVPEPATMLLLGTGLVGIAGATRKKIFKKS